jgi:hypothetical protein
VTTDGGTMTARKGHKQFALSATPEGSGSKGTILMTGRD